MCSYHLLAWETYEHHLALMKREGYPGIIGLAPVFGEGDPKLYHVDFIESPDTTLAQNATEVLTMTLKEGKTKEDLAAAVAVLGPKITAEEGCAKPLAWGETREEPGKTFFLFLGWESSKVGCRHDLLNLVVDCVFAEAFRSCRPEFLRDSHSEFVRCR
jgi:hypothetical protein